MPDGRTKDAVLEQDFLPLRAKILEIAAGLDRLDRAAGAPSADKRRERIREAIELLLSQEPGRAERVQLLFSRDFDKNWRRDLGL